LNTDPLLEVGRRVSTKAAAVFDYVSMLWAHSSSSAPPPPVGGVGEELAALEPLLANKKKPRKQKSLTPPPPIEKEGLRKRWGTK
jgi:hypothetical protein